MATNDAGLTIRPDTSDGSVFRQVYVRRIYDVGPALKPSLVLDLGAYTGISSRWFGEQFPGAIIIAVEAHPENAALIPINAPAAELHQVAVSSKDGAATLYQPRGIHQCSTIRFGKPEEVVGEVQTVRVQAILGGRLPDVVKMDIEGSEIDVLSGDLSWLSAVRVLHVETHDRFVPGCRRAVLSALKRLGRPWKMVPRGGPNTAVVFGGAP